MNSDEQEIRKLVSRWLEASKAGDVATTLSLLSDDVVFMTPGQEPFGKEAFSARSKQMNGVQIEAAAEILEIMALGEWAWMRNRLRVSVTPPGGDQAVHSGYVLTILKKNSAGSWVIARDANVLMPETKK